MVDGDKSLVVSDELFVSIAKRNMEGIVPLYYDMRKAEAKELNSLTIYEGLNAAYTGGNIGYYSNTISKIWNFVDWNAISDDEKKEALDAIRLLCMENNFCIDMAKTLYMPSRPPEKEKLINKYTRLFGGMLPRFFKYAKQKSNSQIHSGGFSLVDKLDDKIIKPQLRFKIKNFGKLKYKMLMSGNPLLDDVDKQEIIEEYTKLNQTYHFKLNSKNQENVIPVISDIRKKLISMDYDESEITDVLVEYLFNKKTPHKELLWQCFGNVIVENLKRNIPKNSKQCVECGKRFIAKSNRQKLCDSCSVKERRKYIAQKVREQRAKK